MNKEVRRNFSPGEQFFMSRKVKEGGLKIIESKLIKFRLVKNLSD